MKNEQKTPGTFHYIGCFQKGSSSWLITIPMKPRMIIPYIQQITRFVFSLLIWHPDFFQIFFPAKTHHPNHTQHPPRRIRNFSARITKLDSSTGLGFEGSMVGAFEVWMDARPSTKSRGKRVLGCFELLMLQYVAIGRLQMENHKL